MADFSEYGVPSKEWTAIESTLPPFSKEVSLEDLKESTNRGREDVARREMVLLAPQVIVKDHSISARDGYALEARSYRATSAPADKPIPIYIHFHGGGFCFAINTNVVVLNVNYRHTPEYCYPTAWNDAEDALDWAHNSAEQLGGERERIVIGGISAGGWLSASLSLANLRREVKSQVNIVGQVLMIPALIYHDCYESQLKLLKDPSLSSYKQNEFAAILPLERIKQFNELLKIDNPDREDRRLNPGYATPEEVRQLPPTTFGIAGADPLRDEALFYGKLLSDNGVPTRVNVFKGVPHGFRRFSGNLSVTKDWDRVIEEGILWALSSPASTDTFSLQAY